MCIRDRLYIDGVSALVQVLRQQTDDSVTEGAGGHEPGSGQLRRLHGVVAAVLCNVSQHGPIRQALADAHAAPTLVHLLRLERPTVKCYKCTKHQFIHLLTATFKDLHFENSKSYKR